MAFNISENMSQIDKDKYLNSIGLSKISKSTSTSTSTSISSTSTNNSPNTIPESSPVPKKLTDLGSDVRESRNATPLSGNTTPFNGNAGKNSMGVSTDNDVSTTPTSPTAAISSIPPNTTASAGGDEIRGLGVEDNLPMEFFFDSYKVKEEFKESGFDDAESLALMKLTYSILKEKLNWINKNYSPKVDLENEAYLFEAAQSELLFETTNSREISLMNMTNGMIILKRRFNNLDNETIAQIKLNDDIIKMEINLFKHENNLHQKNLNLKNSDLNSRILSDMVSGLKSDIESFRWQLTRAGIVAIMLMAISIMGVWNVTKKLAASGTAEESNGGKRGPLLLPVHEQTDEESHDYEADWDERVIV
jgi:hypothetical protein